MAWREKKIKKWSNKDLCDWVKTIGLTNKWESRTLQAIIDTGSTGQDWWAIKGANDLKDSFDIKPPMLARRVYRDFEKVKEGQLSRRATSKAARKVVINEPIEFELQLFGQSRYWRIPQKVNANTTVRRAKELYKAEYDVGNINFDSIIFISESKILSDNATLGQCGIRNQRHLIKVKLKATKENDIDQLKRQMVSKDSEYNLLKQKFERLSEEYSLSTKQVSNKESYARQLQQDIASLKQQNIDENRKYDLLLNKYNNASREIDSLKQNITGKEREINKLSNKCNQLKQGKEMLKQNNNEVRRQNSDLNEECKELKMELKDIKNKYNKWVQQNSDYTTWDYDTVTDWIIGLDKEFIRYENTLRKQLKEEEISGADLTELDTTDLNRFGIKVFKHKKRVMQEIQNLAMQKQNDNIQNNDNIIPYNEGKKETVYINK